MVNWSAIWAWPIFGFMIPGHFSISSKAYTLTLIHHCQRWHALDSLIIPSSPRIWRAIADRLKDNISSPVDTVSGFDQSESIGESISRWLACLKFEVFLTSHTYACYLLTWNWLIITSLVKDQSSGHILDSLPFLRIFVKFCNSVNLVICIRVVY